MLKETAAEMLSQYHRFSAQHRPDIPCLVNREQSHNMVLIPGNFSFWSGGIYTNHLFHPIMSLFRCHHEKQHDRRASRTTPKIPGGDHNHNISVCFKAKSFTYRTFLFLPISFPVQLVLVQLKAHLEMVLNLIPLSDFISL